MFIIFSVLILSTHPFTFIILFLFQNNVFAQEKIAYIDIDKLLNDFISNDNQQQLVDNKFKLDPEIKQQIKIKIIKDIVLEKIIEYTSRLSGNNIYLASLFKKGDKSHNLYKSQLSNIGTLDSKLIRIAFNMYDD